MDSTSPIGVVVLVGLVLVVIWAVVRQQPVGQGPGWGNAGGTPAAYAGPIVTQYYRGSLVQATQEFQRHAPAMAATGYYPIQQVYQPGSYGCGAFLIALILFFVLIGILIFLYMLFVKPAGTLAVTYEYRGIPVPPDSFDHTSA